MNDNDIISAEHRIASATTPCIPVDPDLAGILLRFLPDPWAMNALAAHCVRRILEKELANGQGFLAIAPAEVPLMTDMVERLVSVALADNAWYGVPTASLIPAGRALTALKHFMKMGVWMPPAPSGEVRIALTAGMLDVIESIRDPRPLEDPEDGEDEAPDEVVAARVADAMDTARRGRMPKERVNLDLLPEQFAWFCQYLDRVEEYADDQAVRGHPAARADLRIVRTVWTRLRHFAVHGVWPKPKGTRRSVHSAALRTETEAEIRSAAAACVKELRRKGHGIPLARGWTPRVTISWAASRRCSRGGLYRNAESGINMAPSRHVPVDGQGVVTLREYRHIASDPTIGSLTDANWRDVVWAVVAHEVAHAAQYALLRSVRRKECALPRHLAALDFQTAHGEGWQRLYRILRAALVNPRVRARAAGEVIPTALEAEAAKAVEAAARKAARSVSAPLAVGTDATPQARRKTAKARSRRAAAPRKTTGRKPKGKVNKRTKKPPSTTPHP